MATPQKVTTNYKQTSPAKGQVVKTSYTPVVAPTSARNAHTQSGHMQRRADNNAIKINAMPRPKTASDRFANWIDRGLQNFTENRKNPNLFGGPADIVGHVGGKSVRRDAFEADPRRGRMEFDEDKFMGKKRKQLKNDPIGDTINPMFQGGGELRLNPSFMNASSGFDMSMHPDPMYQHSGRKHSHEGRRKVVVTRRTYYEDDRD